MRIVKGVGAPRVTERTCGGWLAVSGVGASLKIGVTADTEEQARIGLAQAEREWEAILASEPQNVVTGGRSDVSSSRTMPLVKC